MTEASPFAIRDARPEDAATILRFVRDLATYEREPDAVVVTERQLREQLASSAPPFECVIAEDASGPIGFALFFATYSTWRGTTGVHLEDLWVDPSARRRGVAERLMGEIARRLLARGGARLEWRVLKWNELGLALYRKLGAEDLGEWSTMRLDGDRLRQLAERT